MKPDKKDVLMPADSPKKFSHATSAAPFRCHRNTIAVCLAIVEYFKSVLTE
jgi:hypothetical protein